MAYYDVTITYRTRVELDPEDKFIMPKEAACHQFAIEYEDSTDYVHSAKYEIQEVN